MRHNSIATGNLAEAVAKTYFISQGYEVFAADYHTHTADMITRDVTTGELAVVDVKTFECKLTANGYDLIISTGGAQYNKIRQHAHSGIKVFAVVGVGDEFVPTGWFNYDVRSKTFGITYLDGAYSKIVERLKALDVS